MYSVLLELFQSESLSCLWALRNPKGLEHRRKIDNKNEKVWKFGVDLVLLNFCVSKEVVNSNVSIILTIHVISFPPQEFRPKWRFLWFFKLGEWTGDRIFLPQKHHCTSFMILGPKIPDTKGEIFPKLYIHMHIWICSDMEFQFSHLDWNINFNQMIF